MMKLFFTPYKFPWTYGGPFICPWRVKCKQRGVTIAHSHSGMPLRSLAITLAMQSYLAAT